MPLKLKNLIYGKTGINLDFAGLAGDREGQFLVASLMALVAKSDGGISPDEMSRMVGLLCGRFQLRPGDALNMITTAADEVAESTSLDELLKSVNEDIALHDKEELVLMLLHVISADDQKDAGEMQFLGEVIDGLQMPENIMANVYSRYFTEQKKTDK